MSLEDLPVDSAGGASRPLFETVNMLDPELMVKDSILFAVEKSGAQSSRVRQQASSASASGVQFSVVVPSLSTLVSRKIMIETQLVFTVSGTVTTSGDVLLPPNSICLGNFPFAQMVSNASCTINNTTLNLDYQNCLNEILRCVDKETLNEYSSYCPTQCDPYQDYTQVNGADTLNFSNSPFNGFEHAGLNGWAPRGAYITSVNAAQNTVTGAGNAAKSVDVTVKIFEPIIMSPFLLSTVKNSNAAALYGINALDFNFGFRQANVCRALRAAVNAAAGTAVVTLKTDGTGITRENTYLHLCYITPPASLKLPARNIVPYLSLQSYITAAQDLANVAPVAGTNQAVATQTCNAIQLNSVPDSVLIGVRYKAASKSGLDSDSWLPLDNSNPGAITISFNNQSGIQSGANGYDLYEMSKNNGLNMTFTEFSGVANNAISPAAAAAYNQTAGAVGSSIYTPGGLVKLEFGKDIPLNDYTAPGSIGQYSFQCSVRYCNFNHSKYAGNLEVVLIFVNSGMLINELGSSNVYVGLLTKANVLEAAEKPPLDKGSYERMYGSGWWSSLKTGISKGLKYAKPVAKIVRQGLELSSNSKAQKGAKVLSALGAGYSAGGSDKFANRLY
jgi:hypothetical protein